MLQPASVSHSGMKSQLFPETYSGSYLWFYFQRTGCQILSDIREKISLALLALTCVFYVRPVGVVFREERTCIAQLLPAFSLCPRVTTPSLQKPFAPEHFPTVPSVQDFFRSPPPPCLSFSKSDVYAKPSPKFIFSLSIDYLIQKHRTPRRS